MSASEASSSSFNDLSSTGSSANEASLALRRSPGIPLRRGQLDGGPGSPRKLPHCRDCRRPMKGHHKYADCPRVKAKARRLRARARFHGKLKKLRTRVEVVEGSDEDIRNLAQEAEDLRYKTYAVKSGKFTGNQDEAWLVFGEDGRAVQKVGNELQKTLKTRGWGGRAAKLAWKLFSSPTVQDVVRNWVLGWFAAGNSKERLGCEQVKD